MCMQKINLEVSSDPHLGYLSINTNGRLTLMRLTGLRGSHVIYEICRDKANF